MGVGGVKNCANLDVIYGRPLKKNYGTNHVIVLCNKFHSCILVIFKGDLDSFHLLEFGLFETTYGQIWPFKPLNLATLLEEDALHVFARTFCLQR